MVEEACFRCGKKENLVEAIYESEIRKICESCAKVENIPIIKKPTNFQLQFSEKPYTVYERLRRMAHLPKPEPKPELRFDRIRPAKDFTKTKQQKEIESVSGVIKDTSFINESAVSKQAEIDMTEIEIPEETIKEREEIKPLQIKKTYPIEKLPIVKQTPPGLIENFHWYLQRARRKIGLSTKQLAEHIAEKEEDIKTLEKCESILNQDKIINKIEQYLRIKLRTSETNEITEITKTEANPETKPIQAIKPPARILKFDKETLKNLTIADLKRMKEVAGKESEADREKTEELFGEDIELEE